MPKIKPPAEVAASDRWDALPKGDVRRSARGQAWTEVLDEMARIKCQYGKALQNIEERRLKP